MRVVVLSSHTPSLFWFRTDMMQAMQENGHEVYALGNEPEEEWSSKFAEKGITYRQVQVWRNGVNPLNDMKTLLSIWKMLKAIKPDKMFTFQAKTVIYGGIAANLLGIKEVYPLIAGLGSVFLNDGFKTKIIRKILTTEYRIGMRKSPVVFFQNKDDEKVFRDNGIIKKQKVVLLHGSGVNIDHFTVEPMPEKLAFLCTSRLIRDKGVNEYIEACKKIKKQYPHIRCLLVGPFDSNPSALKPEDIEAVVEQGVIEYFGEQTDVRPYLKQSSVFVLPSYREGTPKTVLEAMASGRAVITTDAPGCRETVVDGENGYLVPVKDVDTLYDRMKYFIENPAKVTEMGNKGRKRAEELFDVRLVNQCILDTMQL